MKRGKKMSKLVGIVENVNLRIDVEITCTCNQTYSVNVSSGLDFISCPFCNKEITTDITEPTIELINIEETDL